MLNNMNTPKKVITDLLLPWERIRCLLSQRYYMKSFHEKPAEKFNGEVLEGEVSKDIYVRMTGAETDYRCFMEKTEEDIKKLILTTRPLEVTVCENGYF